MPFAPILKVEGKKRMNENSKTIVKHTRVPGDAGTHTFTPENRRKDGALFRKIGDRIREGYYESSQVLKAIADRMAGIR